MSQLPEPKFVEYVFEQLKMKCPGCDLVFYWVEHHPYCSTECAAIERAADLLKRDHPDGLAEEIRLMRTRAEFQRTFMKGLAIEDKQ